jgi:hypothetical protein
MPASVYSRTLQKAAELVGGQRKLARQLRVPLAELEKWIADKDEPPTAVFLAAVDLVLEETAPPAGGSGSGEPPAPRESAGVDGSSLLF